MLKDILHRLKDIFHCGAEILKNYSLDDTRLSQRDAINLCPPVPVSVRMSASMSVALSVRMSASLSVCLSVCMSADIAAILCIFLLSYFAN